MTWDGRLLRRREARRRHQEPTQRIILWFMGLTHAVVLTLLVGLAYGRLSRAWLIGTASTALVAVSLWSLIAYLWCVAATDWRRRWWRLSESLLSRPGSPPRRAGRRD